MKKRRYTGINIPSFLLFLICTGFLMYSLELSKNIESLFYTYLEVCLLVISILWILYLFIKWVNNNKFFSINLKKTIHCIDNNSFKLLFVFSLIWILITISMLLEDNIIKDMLKILLIKPQHLALNEWGDFLAGFIAPLAFIWIGFGVYYQKKEFGNIVKSFNLQKEEFKKSVDVMKDQVVQIEVQQHNAWFNRNYQSIITIKNKIFDDLKKEKIDSFFTIYKTLHIDFENSEKPIFNVFDEIKVVVDMHNHIDSFIDKELSKPNINSEIINILNTLKEEFNLLKGDDIKYCTKILKKVYIAIVAGKNEDSKYHKYFEAYGHWFDNYDEIYNFIHKRNDIDINKKITSAIKDIDKIKIDFKKGSLNG